MTFLRSERVALRPNSYEKTGVVRGPRVVVGLFALLLVGGACGGDDDGSTGLPRKSLAPPTDSPYVSVAVDNHFHDIHVEDNITIPEDQGFIIKNQGSNLHNVTIPQIEFDRDIETGEQIEFIDGRLTAGTYDIICKYHADQGMVGKLIVE